MSNQLPTQYQQFIHLSRYSRWLEDKGRRETWGETIERYFNFFEEHLEEMCDYKLDKKTKDELETAILEQKVMPSMRCLMTAGEALKRENIAGYNCSYVAVDRVAAFDEILYVLMNGTGVGFSVERQFTAKLPVVAEEFFHSDTMITVADSKMGWAKAFKELVGLLYIGSILLGKEFGLDWLYIAIGVAVLQIISPFTKFCPVYTILNKIMPQTTPMQNGKYYGLFLQI